MKKDFTIKILPDAMNDISEAKDWYNNKKIALGDKFKKYVIENIDDILEFPKAFPVVYKNVRKKVLFKFPYKVFYRIQHDHEILIIAETHYKRSERVFKKRS